MGQIHLDIFSRKVRNAKNDLKNKKVQKTLYELVILICLEYILICNIHERR